MTQSGCFDFEERLASLSGAGDPLENLSQTLDIGLFRKTPDKALRYPDRHQGGRPPFDPVPMVRILSLQTLYDLCDDKTEFMLRDCLSFMRFSAPGLSAPVPAAGTIRRLRERLAEQDLIDQLFARFDRQIEDRGLLAPGGQIMAAPIIEAPRQRNNDKEKGAIEAGDIPGNGQARPAGIQQKTGRPAGR